MNRDFGFKPDSVDYVILSHAHIDHAGLLPRLVSQGYKGIIYCTPQTRELCALILEDSAKIQEQESSRQKRGQTEDKEVAAPLYTREDVQNCLALMQAVPYNKPFTIDEDVELLFTDAGHILGSAVVNLKLQDAGRERRLAFSGDVGRFENRILKRPQEFPQADIIICESTYGNSFHESLKNTEERLRKIVTETCIEKKGKLLIPAFSIGKTQELIYSLNVLAEEGKLPPVKVFVDSPLSVYATDIIREHEECFNTTMQEYIKTDPDPFGFEGLVFVSDHDDSQLLQLVEEPCVIISTSGMLEAGRIRMHLKNNIEDPNSTVLMTGFCEASTLGGRLLAGAKEIELFDETLSVNAEVIMMKEYSAHADYGDFLKFLNCQDKEKVKQVFLVHGENGGMEAFKEELKKEGFKRVEVADPIISYEV